MKSFVRSLIITILSILLLSWLSHSVSVTNTITLVMAGVALAALNNFVRPLLKLLLLPINIITLGLLGWLINILMIYIAMWLVPGFSIGEMSLLGIQFSQFWSVVLFSIFMSLTGSVLDQVL